MSVVLDNMQGGAVDPTDPNVVVPGELLSKKQTRVWMGLGLIIFLGISVAYLFRDSITAALSPKRLKELLSSRKKWEQAKLKTYIQGLFVVIVDVARAVIAMALDYCPREWFFEIVNGVQGAEKPIHYWLVRVDRNLDKIMGIVSTFIFMRMDVFARVGLDDFAQNEGKVQPVNVTVNVPKNGGGGNGRNNRR